MSSGIVPDVQIMYNTRQPAAGHLNRLLSSPSSFQSQSRTLSGCKDNSAMGAFEAMQPRDGSLMTQIAMSSEIKIYDDAGSSSAYQSSATWDDCNGVRHMYAAVSNISIDGSEPEHMYSVKAYAR